MNIKDDYYPPQQATRIITLEGISVDGVRPRNLIFGPHGKTVREMLGLDVLDIGLCPITIHIDEDVDSISTSFFQGLFCPSIQTLGGVENFLKKYTFSAEDPLLLEQIEWLINHIKHKQPILR